VFDRAGTAVGTVPLDRIRVGQRIEVDDVVLGLRSTGVHSNGMTLARQVLRKYRPSTRFDELGRSLGEALLEPTRIYVKEVMDVLRGGVDVRALIHITSDGLLNLLRVASPTGYVIHSLPEPHPIFGVIQREARVSLEEMYRVFNMGIGFCLVVSHHGNHAARARAILARHGVECAEIGRAVAAPAQAVMVEPVKLLGKDGRFRPV
jgi:phosphoribosylformylglycinamidine cyclo-ligase